MHWRRLLTVLAMLAALGVAPSSTSAAPPNELLSPTVAPPAGTTTTPFVLTVRYQSTAGNAAGSVTASVGGRSIPLTLVSGTTADGRWTAVALLPAGTWSVTFRATVDKGSQPKPISAGPVAVGAAASSQPSSPSSDQPSVVADEPGDASSTPDTQPESSNAQSAAQSTAPSSGTAAAASSAIAGPSGGGGAAPASAGASPRLPGSSGGSQRSVAIDASSPPAVAGPVGSSPAASESDTAAATSEFVALVLLIGLAGVAAVAMLGAAWIVIAGRRDRPQPAPLPASSAPDPAISAIPTVEQRSLRRARLRPADDPILAALGLPDDPPAADTPRPGGPDRGRSGRRRRQGTPD